MAPKPDTSSQLREHANRLCLVKRELRTRFLTAATWEVTGHPPHPVVLGLRYTQLLTTNLNYSLPIDKLCTCILSLRSDPWKSYQIFSKY